SDLEFLNLLERLSSRDEAAPEPERKQAPKTAGKGATEWLGLEQPHDPDYATLAEHLRRQTWNSPVAIDRAGWPRLVIDPGSGSWFYDGPMADMKPQTFAQALPASAGKPVSSADLVAEVESVVRRPLSEL